VRENLEDFGHQKRHESRFLANMEYLGFFNDDDQYELTYIEKMLEAVEGYDAAYCAWNRFPNCEFRFGSSTSGNYILRTAFARAVDYPLSGYNSDGYYIDALVKANAVVAPKVEEILYHHNHQS
jgi:hypothetical protein